VSAKGIIEQTLARYGLNTLATWAWNRYLQGDAIEEIMLQMRATPEYKNRFPAMEELSKRGLAFSEEAYIQYEQSIRNMASQYGFPVEVYGDREYIAELLLSDVSPVEAQRRFQLAAAASFTAPPEYREEAARLYGITAGEWASLWLEPDRTLPVLERKYAAVAIAGEATMRNLGDLSKEMAVRLAQVGITPEQARQAFGQVSRELTVRLPGETEAGLGASTVAAGALGVGTEAEQLARLRRQRIAAFSGGGGFATTQRGTAVGAANR
jgi:hypothetical protein